MQLGRDGWKNGLWSVAQHRRRVIVVAHVRPSNGRALSGLIGSPEGGIQAALKDAFDAHRHSSRTKHVALRAQYSLISPTPWLVRTWATRMTRLRHPPTEDRVRRSRGFGAAQQLSSCWGPLKSMPLTQTETPRRFDSL